MCGIVGYLGKQNAVPVLLEGLKRLEYRGYDSAGISFIKDNSLNVVRTAGKLGKLEEALEGKGYFGYVGIGHTRWATHGKPSGKNAHPHRVGDVVVVHNGIIENYVELKKQLAKMDPAKTKVFQSDTDTEVIAHLVFEYKSTGLSFSEAVYQTLKDIKGTYALCIISSDEPDRIICVKNGCPLLIGIGQGEYYIGSDMLAFLKYTREIITLNDMEVVILDNGKDIFCTDINGNPVQKQIERINWDVNIAEKGGFKHFMEKEIHEQPQSISDTLASALAEKDQETDIFLPSINLEDKFLENLQRVVIVACGTSWHAGLVGKFLIEELARVNVEVDIASEFRYRDPILGENDIVVTISQSGETADTHAALKEARKKGARVVSICNVLGSSIVRGSDGVIITHAGPEIGVASTKAFTTQLAALFLLAVRLGESKNMIKNKKTLIDELSHIPALLKELLNSTDQTIRDIAKRYFKYADFLFLGRGINYPIALEGALKLKEISYIHAEGYPAGEMKHGPIALIDENMPVVVLAPQDSVFEKIASNIMEVKSRGGKVIAVLFEDDFRLDGKCDEIIRIPKVSPLLSPFLLTVPLQLLSYYIALQRGCDVDQPRNLAKSVTVE